MVASAPTPGPTADPTVLGRLGGVLMGLTTGVAKAAAIGYVGICAVVFVFQRKLQYFPTTEHPPAPSTLPPAYGDIEEFTVRTEDGVTIRGYHLPVPTMNQAHCKHPKIHLLQLHGNAGSRYHRVPWAHYVRTRLGCSVTLLDYRGYGGSEGKVNEAGMILDGKAGIQWAATRANETGSKLVLHLESIGSAAGVCAAAALRKDNESGADGNIGVAGIVAEGGLSSCVEIAEKVFSFLPVRVLMKDKWDGVCSAAASLDPATPFMSMHGTRDEIVPFWCGKKLFESSSSTRKVFKEFKRGGHNNLADQAGYIEALDEFYTAVELL